jgi:hypothetical protein
MNDAPPSIFGWEIADAETECVAHLAPWPPPSGHGFNRTRPMLLDLFVSLLAPAVEYIGRKIRIAFLIELEFAEGGVELI